MIKEITDTLKYNKQGHYYYLTDKGIQEYAGVKLDDAAGKRHGRDLHNKIIKSAYNGEPVQYRHRDIIEWRIFKNINGERDAIIEMLALYAEWDYHENGYLKQFEDKYVDNKGSKLPQSIMDIGIDAGIIFKGEICFKVPDEDWATRYSEDNTTGVW